MGSEIEESSRTAKAVGTLEAGDRLDICQLDRWLVDCFRYQRCVWVIIVLRHSHDGRSGVPEDLSYTAKVNDPAAVVVASDQHVGLAVDFAVPTAREAGNLLQGAHERPVNRIVQLQGNIATVLAVTTHCQGQDEQVKTADLTDAVNELFSFGMKGLGAEDAATDGFDNFRRGLFHGGFGLC